MSSTEQAPNDRFSDLVPPATNRRSNRGRGWVRCGRGDTREVAPLTDIETPAPRHATRSERDPLPDGHGGCHNRCRSRSPTLRGPTLQDGELRSDARQNDAPPTGNIGSSQLREQERFDREGPHDDNRRGPRHDNRRGPRNKNNRRDQHSYDTRRGLRDGSDHQASVRDDNQPPRDSDARVLEPDSTAVEAGCADYRRGPRDSDDRRAPREYDDRRGPRDYDDRRAPREYDDRRGPRDYDDRRGPRDYDDRRGPRDYDDRRGPRDYDGRRAPRDYDDRRGPRDYDDRRGPRDYDDRHAPRDYDDRRGPRDYSDRRDPVHNDDQRQRDSDACVHEGGDEAPRQARRDDDRRGPRDYDEGPRDYRRGPREYDDAFARKDKGRAFARPAHADPRDTRHDRPGVYYDPDPRYPNRVVRAPALRRNNFDAAEVEALFAVRHNQQGISFENYDRINVDIVPSVEPIQTFDELHIDEKLADNIRRCGYTRPTPVQKYSFPVVLAGHDLMACAQTGSGKTAAFLVPSIQRILVHGVSPAQRGAAMPIALVLAPTRELASQIYDDARKLTFHTDIFCDVAYGGSPYPRRFENDILVACPGRLKDLFTRHQVRFANTSVLILDEADRMLEMGFEEQIEFLVASEYTDMPPPQRRQTLMFSATFPASIRQLAHSYLREEAHILTLGKVGSTTRNITQRVLWVEDADKRKRLLDIIMAQDQRDLVLVFAETKRETEDLFLYLRGKGISVGTIHGDRRQTDREEALRRFKEGRCPVLVATDVASRGLDIPDVAHVVQYELPQSIDDYTHRIGRTGRAGNVGTATAFYNRRNAALADDLSSYLREHDQDIPSWLADMQEERHVAAFQRQVAGGKRNAGGHRGKSGGGGAAGRLSELERLEAEFSAEPRRPKSDGVVAPPKQRPVAPTGDDGGF